jgi:hypothetical protein
VDWVVALNIRLVFMDELHRNWPAPTSISLLKHQAASDLDEVRLQRNKIKKETEL